MATQEQRITELRVEIGKDVRHFKNLSGIPLTQDHHGAAAGLGRVPNNATTDQAIRALTPQEGSDWGDTFPLVVWPGRQFKRTDIDDGTLFWWDEVRSRWLGQELTIDIGEPSDDDRIHFGRIEISNLATDGVVLPFDAVITRTFAANRQNQNETMTLTVYQDSVSSYTLDWVSASFADTGPIDTDWPAGTLLNGRIASTTGTFTRLYGHITYKRVAQ